MLALALLLTAEFGVGQAVVGSHPAAQREAAAAQASDFTLVVWTDGRHRAQLFGTRIAPSGELLDPRGLLIGEGSRPAVACGVRACLVVWRQEEILAVRVTRDGQVLGPPVTLSEPGADDRPPRVVWSGDRFVVTWSRNRYADAAPSQDVLAREVSEDATPGPTVVVATDVKIDEADVGAVAGGALLVWRARETTIQAARFSAGASETPVEVATQWKVSAPRVAGGAGSYLVVWSSSPSMYASHVYGRRMGAAGTPIDSEAQLTSDGWEDTPAVSWDGSEFVLAWRGLVDSGSRLRAQRVAAGGLVGVVGDDLGSAGYRAGRPAVAGSLVVWDDDAEVRGWSGPGPARVLSTGVNAQWAPRVLATPAGHVVSWQDSASSGGEAALLEGGATRPLAGYWQAAAGDRLLMIRSQPSVDGSRPPELSATVRLADGRLLDPAPLGDGHDVHVASDGTEFLVVYQKQPGVVAVRIDRDGHVRDAVPLELASFSAFYPISLDVSFGGGVYLVVWEQARGNSTAMMDVRATRVTPAGEVLDAPSRVLVAGAGQDMSVASDGERFLVAYWDGDIYGVVVGADGAVARSRVALATGDKTYVQPRLAWDGARYLLLCAERAWLGQGALRDDAILLALDRDGAAAGDPVRVADDVVLEQLSLASRGDGSALVAYARYDASPDLQSVRVKLRTITPDQAPPRPDDMPPPGDVSAQGCGCRAGDAGGGGDGWAVLLLLLAAAVLARRRAAR